MNAFEEFEKERQTIYETGKITLDAVAGVSEQEAVEILTELFMRKFRPRFQITAEAIIKDLNDNTHLEIETAEARYNRLAMNIGRLLSGELSLT